MLKLSNAFSTTTYTSPKNSISLYFSLKSKGFAILLNNKFYLVYFK